MMRPFGVVIGLLMIGSFFMRWEAPLQGMGLIAISHFLGIETYVFFHLLGRGIHFLPIVAALVFLTSMFLLRHTPGRFLGLCAAALCLIMAAINVWKTQTHAYASNVRVGPGLWLYFVASCMAFGMALWLVRRSTSGSAT